MKMKKALNDFPEWQEAQKKLIDAQVELVVVDGEKTKILSHVAEKNHTDHLARAAEELLAGGKPSMPRPEDDRLDELRFKERVLKRAIVIQQGVLDNLRKDLSRQICDENRPQYRKLVQDVVRASAVLLEAVEAEMDFREQLTAGGASVEAHLRPTILYGAKHRLTYFLGEAKKAGYQV